MHLAYVVEHFGGSGSLMLDSRLIGEQQHLQRPFVIGRINEGKGYVHVFDDTSLDVVMGHLDTVSDFIAYLTKKERFLTGDVHVRAAGEEELLGAYVKRLNAEGEHDIIIPKGTDHVLFREGLWHNFLNSDECRAQRAANEISYSWDLLIEKFLHHLMSGTQYTSTHSGINEQEKSFRWLARENRTRRRMLARSLHELLGKTPIDYRASRLLHPSRPGDPYFLFLLLPRDARIEEKDYRRVRFGMLEEYCMVVKLHCPDAQNIIGIATETLSNSENRSEDFVHLDTTVWNDNLEQQALASKRDLGIFVDVKPFAGRMQEYPVDEKKEQHVSISSKLAMYLRQRQKVQALSWRWNVQ